MRTAVLYYLPAGAPPSGGHLAEARRLLGGVGVEVLDVDVDPPSSWLVSPEFGFVWLGLDRDVRGLSDSVLEGDRVRVVLEGVPE